MMTVKILWINRNDLQQVPVHAYGITYLLIYFFKEASQSHIYMQVYRVTSQRSADDRTGNLGQTHCGGHMV